MSKHKSIFHFLILIYIGLLPLNAFAKTISEVESFAFAIGLDLSQQDIEPLKKFDLVIVDAANTSISVIHELQLSGVLVAGYLSIGTIEKGRPWFKNAKKYRLDFWPEWGEWYADVAAPGFRRLILRRVLPDLLEKGFDAIFLDNVDMITLHPTKTSAMYSLMSRIKNLLSSKQISLGAQNSTSQLKRLARFCDFWNLENVSTEYNFKTKKYSLKSSSEIAENQSKLCLAKNLGLKVFSTDYLPSNSDELPQVLSNSCICETVPYISDIYLTNLPATPISCN